MKDTIGAVMHMCRHYFPVDWLDGEWSVKGGVISPKMLDGVIAITGSTRLNGVWEVVDGKICTIEGNTGSPNQVLKKGTATQPAYDLTDPRIVGYARPDYSR